MQTTIQNFSRYYFVKNELGKIIAMNIATERPIELYSAAKTPSYRLTNDEGKRVVVKVEEIMNEFPKEAMQPLLSDEGTDLEKSNVITTDLPEVKIPETAKEESKDEKPKKERKVCSGKLSEEQVKAIRQRALNGEKQAALAVEFKINPSTVSEIKTGVLFKKVTAGIVATVTEETKEQSNQQPQ